MKTNWQEDWDKKFPKVYKEVYDKNVDDRIIINCSKQIKSFIENLLKNERKKTEEEWKKKFEAQEFYWKELLSK